MNLKVLFFVIILFFFTTSSFAQEPILVEVSSSSYEEGDIIVISGKVSTIILDYQVTIQIFNEGNLIEIAQLVVAQDGSFTHTIIAQGPQWQNEGNYAIRASYGEGNVAEANFEFFLYKEIAELSDYYEVNASPYGTFDVEYIIRGGILETMKIEPEIFALIVDIESTSDGSIILDLPREAIDAKKSDGSDDLFIIIIDGMEVIYDEAITNENTRTITIQFEEDDSDIIVIGTQIIPEFGTIAPLILAVSIISVIILSTKKKMQIGLN
ncbi:MAG: PEFG-CTERM sorting domain-containing protein [Thaumarchaeota archaeon]|nr:PEFG-CTERM sorting domain-containing protein [Nitrososphaerota archaeon]